MSDHEKAIEAAIKANYSDRADRLDDGVKRRQRDMLIGAALMALAVVPLSVATLHWQNLMWTVTLSAADRVADAACVGENHG